MLSSCAALTGLRKCHHLKKALLALQEMAGRRLST